MKLAKTSKGYIPITIKYSRFKMIKIIQIYLITEYNSILTTHLVKMMMEAIKSCTGETPIICKAEI
jgi:hypothetical protein